MAYPPSRPMLQTPNRAGPHPPAIRAATPPRPSAKPGTPPSTIITIAVLALLLGAALTWAVLGGRDGNGSAGDGGGAVGAGGAGNPLPPTDGSTYSINLVGAANRGCSPDSNSPPDLRITVTVDGAEVIKAYAEQVNDPVYAASAEVRIREGGAQVVIKAEEAEPAGFMGWEDAFFPCDAAPGDATAFTLLWDGGFQQVTARGDSAAAVEVHLVLGPGTLPKPKVQAQPKGTDGVTVTWDTHEAATGHRLAAGRNGAIVRTLGPAAGSADVTGLCDNTSYVLRVVRDASPWAVSSQDVEVKTLNAPPAAPTVLSAKREGSRISLKWEEKTTHDIARYEFHVGSDASFTPSEATRAGAHATTSSFHQQSWTTNDKAGSHIRIVAVDTGGLSTPSAAFRIGDPDRAATLQGVASCVLR